MPITSGAKKALRASARKRVFNLRRDTTMKKAVKEFKELVSSKKKEEAKALISKVYQAIDKAAKTNVISPNTAARKKSRLIASLKKIS